MSEQILEDAFQLGIVAKALRLMEPDPSYRSRLLPSLHILRTVSDTKIFRSRLRDAGVIALCLSLIDALRILPTVAADASDADPLSDVAMIKMCIDTLCNLAQSEGLHTSIRDADPLNTLEAVSPSKPLCVS